MPGLRMEDYLAWPGHAAVVKRCGFPCQVSGRMAIRVYRLAALPLAVLLVALSVPMAACNGRPYVVEMPGQYGMAGANLVSVVNHGWHTGLVVPAAQLENLLPELRARFPGAAYYELGWGDQGFYQAQEITTGLTLQAMFWSSGAALHVAAIHGAPGRYFAGAQIARLCLADPALGSLMRFIADSFYRGADGKIVALKNGIYGNSQFYAAEGRYQLLNTCNKWTAKALRSAGMDLLPAFKLTAGSVMDYLDASGATSVPGVGQCGREAP